MTPWLHLRNLCVRSLVTQSSLVDISSLRLRRGERVAVIGASGSGKSTLARALLGLLSSPSLQVEGDLSIASSPRGETEQTLPLGGTKPHLFGAIFQDPGQSLTPHLTIGEQLFEAMPKAPRHERRARVLRVLQQTGIRQAEARLRHYPHALSGGLKQRVALCMALLQRPALLIADEPTTALDATVQAEVLASVRAQCAQHDMGLLLITHDVAVAARMCERVIVLEQGRVVEDSAIGAVLQAPAHRATRALVGSAKDEVDESRSPRSLPCEPSDAPEAPVLRAESLGVSVARPSAWPMGRMGRLPLLRDISFHLQPKEIVALVGESGAGKSTLGRAIARLVRLEAGTLHTAGRVQMVFQDPKGSLDPTQTAREAVAEAVTLSGPGVTALWASQKAEQLLGQVGLMRDAFSRKAQALSGGQAQRVALARALATRPCVLVADEATSALDGESKRQVLDLLRQVATEQDIAVLFITHDIRAVVSMASRAMTLFGGHLVEIAPAQRLLKAPLHPYSQRLMRALLPLKVPSTSEAAAPMDETSDEALTPWQHLRGCVAQARCPLVAPRCRIEPPRLRRVSAERYAACHFVPEAPPLRPERR